MYLEPKKIVSNQEDVQHSIYDKKRLFFDYYDKDQFKDLQKEQGIVEEDVYGEINLVNVYDGDYDKESERRYLDVIKISDRREDTAKLYEVKKTKESHHKKAVGYMQVEINGDTKYIRVLDSKGAIPFWLWLLLGAGIGLIAFAVCIHLGVPKHEFILVLAKHKYATPIKLGVGLIGIMLITNAMRGIRYNFIKGSNLKPNHAPGGGAAGGLMGGVLFVSKVATLIIAALLVATLLATTMNIKIPFINDDDNGSEWISPFPFGSEDNIGGGSTGGSDSDNLEYADGEDWDGKLPERQQDTIEQEYIEIAGYTDLLVTESNPTIALINTTGNTVYQQYIISLDGVELYDSKLIAPGQQVQWNAYEALDAGTHDLNFQINTYDVETKEPCNGAKQLVDIEVRK